MKKCVKILITMPIDQQFITDVVQGYARKLSLEGVAHIAQPDSIKIVVVGVKESIDQYIDLLHKESAHYKNSSLEVEPFIKDRDYRSVFRVID